MSTQGISWLWQPLGHSKLITNSQDNGCCIKPLGGIGIHYGHMMKFSGMMHSTMKQILKWPYCAKFCAFHCTLKFAMIGLGQVDEIEEITFHGTLKFSMIGLGQEDEIEEITLQSEIWWHDAVYHEADHCMKWPHSADVFAFSDLGRPRVLSFSERLVIECFHWTRIDV